MLTGTAVHTHRAHDEGGMPALPTPYRRVPSAQEPGNGGRGDGLDARTVRCLSPHTSRLTHTSASRPFVLEILKERNDAQAAAAAQSAGKYFTEKPKSKKRKRDTQASSDDEVVEVGE